MAEALNNLVVLLSVVIIAVYLMSVALVLCRVLICIARATLYRLRTGCNRRTAYKKFHIF